MKKELVGLSQENDPIIDLLPKLYGREKYFYRIQHLVTGISPLTLHNKIYTLSLQKDIPKTHILELMAGTCFYGQIMLMEMLSIQRP